MVKANLELVCLSGGGALVRLPQQDLTLLILSLLPHFLPVLELFFHFPIDLGPLCYAGPAYSTTNLTALLGPIHMLTIAISQISDSKPMSPV